MKKEISEAEYYGINDECEAVHCSDFAKKKLEIKLENIGIISLLLCDKCKVKFLEGSES
jgi:hypothetical protein